MSATKPSVTARRVAAAAFFDRFGRDPRDGERLEVTLEDLEGLLAQGQESEADHSAKVEAALSRANRMGAELDRQIAWIAQHPGLIIAKPSCCAPRWSIAWPADGAISIASGPSFALALAQAAAPD